MFQSDMRIVANFLAQGKAYHSNRKIVHKAALIKMIKVLSGDMNIEGIEDWLAKQGIKEEDEIMVCELFDQYERKGRAEERINIIRNMLHQGMSEELIIKVTGCTAKELLSAAK